MLSSLTPQKRADSHTHVIPKSTFLPTSNRRTGPRLESTCRNQCVCQPAWRPDRFILTKGEDHSTRRWTRLSSLQAFHVKGAGDKGRQTQGRGTDDKPPPSQASGRLAWTVSHQPNCTCAEEQKRDCSLSVRCTHVRALC